MAIQNITYSNTFGQWLISTNQTIDEVNTLKNSNYTKTGGTLYLNSPSIGLSVGNNALFSGNTTFSGGLSRNVSFYLPTYFYNTLTINSNTSIVATGNVFSLESTSHNIYANTLNVGLTGNVWTLSSNAATFTNLKFRNYSIYYSGNFSTANSISFLSNYSLAINLSNTSNITFPGGDKTLVASGFIVNNDINANAGIVDTKLATISTAGKVLNSATTATSANTASAIVARDSAGNFTARTATFNVAQGTAPLTVTSNTVITNLNADLLDGFDSSYFAANTENERISGSWTFTQEILGTANAANKLTNTNWFNFSGDVAGSGSYNGTGNTNITLTVQPNSVALGTDTTGNYVQEVQVSGTGLSVANTNPEGGIYTVTSNASSANGSGTIVARDSAGNFAARTATFNVAQGTAPLTVTSTTKVTNLNAELLDGFDSSYFAANTENEIISGSWSFNQEILGTANAANKLTNTNWFNFSGDVAGSGSYDGTANTSVTLTIQPNSVALGTDTTGKYTGEVKVSGTGLTVANTAIEGGDFTITSNASSANGSGTIVARDTAGNFTARTATFNVAQGTAPLTVTSNTVVTNLNADLVDGKQVGTTGSSIPVLDSQNYWTGSQIFLNTSNWFGYQTANTSPNSAIEIGLATNYPFIDFHSSNTIVDYNARISCSGSETSIANGQLNFEASQFIFSKGVISGNGAGITDVTASTLNGKTADYFSANTEDELITGQWIFSKQIFGTANDAVKLQNTRWFNFTGLATGSGSYNGTGNTDISLTIQNNSVALGTHTTGNYVKEVKVSGTGLTVANTGVEGGDFTITSNASSANGSGTIVARDSAGNFTARTATFDVAQGTSPLTVTSTTVVTNLNADLLDGLHSNSANSSSTIVARDSAGNINARTGTFNVAQGTSPLTVTSTTLITNLNADLLDGYHVGTSGATIPILDGINSWTNTQTFNNDVNVIGNFIVSGNTVFAGATINDSGDYILRANTGSTTSSNSNFIVKRNSAFANANSAIIRWDNTALSWKLNDVTTDQFYDIIDNSPTQTITGSWTFNQEILGTANAANKLANTNWFHFTGDVAGSGSYNGTGNTTVTLTIQANSVALGTDTTGKYTGEVKVSGTGLTVANTGVEGGDFTITSNASSANGSGTIVARDSAGNFTARTGTFNVAQGTAPLTVTSTTLVTNLNADLLDGLQSNSANSASTIVARDSNGDFSANRITSTVSTGTAPLTVTSTTKVNNLNAELLDGFDSSYFAANTENEIISGNWTFTKPVVINEITQQYGSANTFYYFASANTANQEMCSLNCRSTELLIQANTTTEYYVTKILAIQDGTNVYLTEYGTVATGNTLASFNCDVSSGNIRVLTTPTFNNTTFKINATQITK